MNNLKINNMQIQYRIRHVNGLCYPQCRVKGFVFWGKWFRIARHNDGFGLYCDDSHSKTREECLSIINDYHEWKGKGLLVSTRHESVII